MPNLNCTNQLHGSPRLSICMFQPSNPVEALSATRCLQCANNMQMKAATQNHRPLHADRQPNAKLRQAAHCRP